MDHNVSFLKLRTSWTKYDIVRVMEVIENLDILNKFKNKEAGIDEPILRSFLGIKSLNDSVPDYWIKIQKFPKEKKIFAFLATLFTHGEIVNEFATKYSTGDMKGVFITGDGKQYTNIRSALIESGAALPIYRKIEIVPYDFSPIFQNPEVGKLFKLVLLERISRLTKDILTDTVFYEICFANNFHKALSISEEQFINWTQGQAVVENNYIKRTEIFNFFSIENVSFDFENVKEIYFLGENGDGKSLILMAIYLAFNGNYIIEKTEKERTGKVADIINLNKNLQLLGVDDKGNEYTLDKGIFLNNFYAYGTHRGRYRNERSELYGFMSLFDSEQTLLNPSLWLKDQKLLELEKNLDNKNMFGELKNLPNSFSVVTLQAMFYELLEKHVEIKIEGSEVLFKEKGTFLSFEQLSDGYKSILIFVSDLISRLNENATEGKTIADLKGIVLVDEIDLHLHPKWQRKVLGYLSNKFPNTQFIATAHSPLIVQAATDANIVLLKRRGTQVFINNDPEIVRNWRIDQVLTSDLFGLSTSRRPDVQKMMDDRKSILSKQIISVKEKITLNKIEQNLGEIPEYETKVEKQAYSAIDKVAELLNLKVE